MKATLIRSFHASIAKAAPIAEEVRLRMAVAVVNRKSRLLVRDASQLLAGSVNREQFQTVVSELDRICKDASTTFRVPTHAVVAKSHSVRLLRSLATAKPTPSVVVIPVMMDMERY